MDPDQNKDNPYAPSPLMSLESQLLYKVAGLEQSVRDMTKRLDEKFDRVISELNNKSTDIIKDQTEMSTRFTDHCKKTEDRLKQLEEWRSTVVTRIATIGSGVLVLWTVAGDAVKHFIFPS
jgi:TolA-binding protein